MNKINNPKNRRNISKYDSTGERSEIKNDKKDQEKEKEI